MHNQKRLFWASFVTILATGIAFSVRGGILDDWGTSYGFTKSELGEITGMGLVGFGLTIILFSAIADRIGYRMLMRVAFLLHLSSAILTLAATPLFAAYGKGAAYWCLYAGMLLLSLGNGTCEAVVNPLVATLYPNQKTHYLNILHAGWPGGLVLGAALSVVLKGQVRWEIQWALFLAPVVLYGLMLAGQKFPVSEAEASGATFGTMLKTVLGPLFIALIVLHALVGYVELGTDSWISQITGDIMGSPKKGLLLFIYTSTLMFALRFVAGPIVHRISSLGLLLASALLGAVGLLFLSSATTILTCILATTVYAFGKTFLWPTMLGVASEKFPRSGALGLGVLGGVGMLSAGLLGTPGIGYKQDYYASENLKNQSSAVFDRYVSPDQKSFLVFPAIAGLDGAKVGALMEKPAATLSAQEKEEQGLVKAAGLFGGRMALRWTAIVPMLMALGYFGLMVAFGLRRRAGAGEAQAAPAAE